MKISSVLRVILVLCLRRRESVYQEDKSPFRDLHRALSFVVSLEQNVSEIAEELMFLCPVHLRGLPLFFGTDLHLFFCRRSAETQAHLGKGVRQLATFIICQLEMMRQTDANKGLG